MEVNEVDRWKNTFKFLETTLYPQRKNYSEKEVELMIEQKLKVENVQEFVGVKNNLK